MRDYNDFLNAVGWGDADIRPLAGDASNRRYGRIAPAAGRPGAILMDSPPDKGENIAPFIAIDQHLRALGLSAPEIYAKDEANGFLILEDLGDDLFARLLNDRPDMEGALYTAATDVLIELQKAPLPDVDRYDPPLMTQLAALAFDKYQNFVCCGTDHRAKSTFETCFLPVLSQTCTGSEVLALRDYHAENLIWLPKREGAARVGLIDFQDAMAAHPAYDLVSLLQDARRDVSPTTQEAMIAHYVRQTGQDDTAFRTAYAVLGVQRNLRILGVFARLSVEYKRPSYVKLIPRVWAHLQRGLTDPALSPVADLLAGSLPEPDETTLTKLQP